MYKGKEPCQGCGKPGNEKHRMYKDRLCSSCQQVLDKFKTSEIEATTMTYVRVTQPRWGVFDISSRGGKNLSLSNMFVDSVLRGFNNENAPVDSGIKRLGSLSGGACQAYRIPEIVYKALVKSVAVIEEAVKEIREQQDAAFIAANTQLKKERERIYNEGVAKGRNLLMQLNSGEITIDDFNKTQNYNNGSKF